MGLEVLSCVTSRANTLNLLVAVLQFGGSPPSLEVDSGKMKNSDGSKRTGSLFLFRHLTCWFKPFILSRVPRVHLSIPFVSRRSSCPPPSMDHVPAHLIALSCKKYACMSCGISSAFPKQKCPSASNCPTKGPKFGVGVVHLTSTALSCLTCQINRSSKMGAAGRDQP